MKLIWKVLLSVICLCLVLNGCSPWPDGFYASVSPNHSPGENHTDGVVTVSSYLQIRDALVEIVENGLSDGTLHILDLPVSHIKYYMDGAIHFVHRINPIGAYAVNEITYDIDTSTGKPAVSLDITYIHNRSEILQIKNVDNMDDVRSLMRIALQYCQARTVVKVTNFSDTDLIQYVENYVNQYPQICMEMPQVSVSYFPESGQERVIEIVFFYQTDCETFRVMQQSVGNIFTAAQYYINPNAENDEKYSQLYSFLMERYNYKIETSITPAYSLLRHGVGDSKAFAIVYAAMCRHVGLDCQVVSGTRDGEAWHWNVFREGDECYYIDLLKCSENGRFSPKKAEETEGYVWDYSAF